MSRTRIVLGAAGVVLTAAAFAAPALAGVTEQPRPEQAPRSELAPVSTEQPKYPGDPFEGKCVYWLKGDNKLRECGS